MRRPHALSVLLTVVIARPAYADDEARELFERALALKDVNNYADACPLFERSMRLAPGAGTLLNVAACLSHFGRYQEARALFERVEREATAAGATKAAERARAEIIALDKVMPQLTIELGSMPTSTTVELDGKPIAVGTQLPIDPGTHRIRAAGARHVDYVAKAGHTGTITLETAGRQRPREVLYLSAGAGGALVLGTITGIVTLSKRNHALERCERTDGTLVCDSQGAVNQLDTAQSLSHVTTGLFAIGLGLGAAAGYLEWRSRREPPPIVIESGPERVSVGIRGRW